jgi:hypothetical protein
MAQSTVPTFYGMLVKVGTLALPILPPCPSR